MRILEIHSRVNDLADIEKYCGQVDALYVMGIYAPTDYSRQFNRAKGLDPSLFSIYAHSFLDTPAQQWKSCNKPVIVDFIPNHLGVQEYFSLGFPCTTEPNYRGINYGQVMKEYWLDVLQLNYERKETLERMTEELAFLASSFDGVRCDMAHLLLKDTYNANHQTNLCFEPWSKLIPEAKRIKKDFIFIAETYGYGTHQQLLDLGFDYVYGLYVGRDFGVTEAQGYLSERKEYLEHLLVTIDTHDDEFLWKTKGFCEEKLSILSQFQNTMWYLPAVQGFAEHPSPTNWKRSDVRPEIRQLYEKFLLAEPKHL